MPRHWSLVVLSWIGWIIWALGAAVFAFAGAVAVALAFGPVSLGPLAPVLLNAVSDPVAGFRLGASDALLSWSPELGTLVVRFVDPRIVDDKGIELAAATDIAISFSLEALVEGKIAPRSLHIAGPTATFMKMSDGSFDFGIRTEVRRDRKVSAANADAGPFIEALLEPPVEGEEDTYLSEIRLTDATMTFIDQVTDSIVKAPRGTLVLQRTATGLRANLEGQVSLPKGNWRFFAEASYDRGSPVLVLNAGLQDANLDSLADAGPMFEPFAGASLPLSGSLTMAIDVKGTVRNASVNVTAGAGRLEMDALAGLVFDVQRASVDVSYDHATDLFVLNRLDVQSSSIKGLVTGDFKLLRAADRAINGWAASLQIQDGYLALPTLFDGDTPVNSLMVKADGDLTSDVITLRQLDVDSRGSTINLAGQIFGLAAGKPALKMTGGFANVPLERLGTLWPKGVAKGARDWIEENARGGLITTATLNADLSAEHLESGQIPNEAMRLAIDYEGLAINYIDGLPPLADARGTAVVLGNRFEGLVESGHVGDLTMSNGRVLIDDLNIKGYPADIKGEINGSAKDVLMLIDHEPLGYPSKYGLDPATVGGRAKILLSIVVPTLAAVKVEDIVFDIKAALSGVAMEVVENVRLTEGEADFVITGTGLTAKGRGKVAGVTANFAWDENFSPAPGQTSTRFEANAKIDENLRRTLGVDPGSYLDGVADVSVSMTGRGFNPMTASADVNLVNAALNIPELGYRKAPGQSARMTAELERVEGGYRAAPVQLKGQGIDAELDILLGPDGSLRNVKANRLVAGRNDVGFTVDLSGAQTTVVADVAVIDLDTLVEALMEPGEAPPPPGETAEPAPPSTPLNVLMRIKAKRVLMRAGAEAQDVQFNVNLDRGWLRELLLQGRLGRGSMLAKLTPQANGMRHVSFQSDEIGLFVHGLTGFESLSGGFGNLSLTFPRIGAAGMPSGVFAMRDFRLLDQPFFVRLLAAGSFTGLIDLLEGEGILFEKLIAGIRLNGDRIEVQDLVMSGPSAGATGDGFVDRETDELAARGTLAPIYSLNTILSDVPLVGDVLGGEKGILAITFAIQGTVDDLALDVNPLSVLAPGFLRAIFEFDSPIEDGTQGSKTPG